MGKVNDLMKFITDIDKNQYDNFVKNHPTKAHFLQSYAWGEFSHAARGLIPHYVGLVNEDDKLVCASLLLQKKLPLGYSYFYAPRGFVIDFYATDLLTEFVKKVKEYVSKKRAIFLKIDPDIVYREYDYEDKEVPLAKNPQEVFDHLTSLGFRHLGFTKNFETMQPRYTFRIDLSKSMEEIESKFSKTTMQRINKGKSLGCKVRLGDENDIEEFNHLMELTEARKDFISHDLNYYKKLFEIYNRDNHMDLFMGSIDCDEVINDYQREKEELLKTLKPLEELENPSKSNKTKMNELTKRIEKLDEYIVEYREAKEKYGNPITLSSHVIMEYGDKAWVLYAGNHNVLTSSYANYTTYYEHIKYCHEHKIKMYDQFGTIGDLDEKNPRYGLHLFKKKFGGDYVEFLGEFDLVTNKFMYFIFTKLVPLYRKVIRNITKLKRGGKNGNS